MLRLVFAIGLFFKTPHADNWAVLIAGSNYFYNYRHQADVCHAYQILTTKGRIPASNIIVMMFDDIAQNIENPEKYKGKIFNHPNGTDVYAGVTIDYRGNAVNKTTFLKVLRGDKSAGGKVLESNENDDVFIYYSDHGATGLVAMPVGDVLYADELISALKDMHSKKMYRQLVFYLEACESGSMFDGLLPKNLTIFATTAANSDESSYAYYFWKPVSTYLGDEYSIRWMEDSDVNWNKHESLLAQFAHVKKQVTESHPQKFGTTAWEYEPISDFQGDTESKVGSTVRSSTEVSMNLNGGAISSRDVKLFYLMEKYDSLSKEVAEEFRYRGFVKKHIRAVVDAVIKQSNMLITTDQFMSVYRPPRHFDCLREVKDEFSRLCEPLVEYGLGFVKNLVQLCETFSLHVIIDSIGKVCL